MTAAPAGIKPDSILHELTELWTSLSKEEAGKEPGKEEPGKEEPGKQEADGVLRACAMTLFVFVDAEAEAESTAMGETLAQLMRGHPSRTIVIRLGEDPGMLDSRVFAQCWMPLGQHRQICCEQIEISVPLNRITDIPSIVGPLAAPDVPRVLWFRSSRIETVPDIGELLNLGDKMIVDSARPGSPTFADLRVLANAGYTVGDLAWTRITKLRQLIAQLLNGRDLKGIREAAIEYCGKEAPPEAKYLRAWLRSNLEAAEVALRRSSDSGKSRITAVRIEPDIFVRVEKSCAEFETAALQQRANIGESTDTDLLNEELNIMIHDRIFERTLQRMTVWAPRS